MNADIKITILVTIYNVEYYLRKCIESILCQSYRNIEVILVDDGSTDGCSDICDHYVEIDKRIKVIHKQNGGVVSARKAGTAASTGDYILSVDGDDWIEKDRIEMLVVEGIIPCRPDMVCLSGYRKDFEEESVLIDSEIPKRVFYKKEIRKQVFSLLFGYKEIFRASDADSLWAWAIKRELLQEKQAFINEKIVFGEDVLCCWGCLLAAESVALIKNNGYHYTQRLSSALYRGAMLSEDNDFRIKIWYHQFKRCLEVEHAPKEIYQIFLGIAIKIMMQTNYEALLRKNSKYLYPFFHVKRGDKLIVYGAGKIGYSLMRYLDQSKDYQVMLWVDRNKKRKVLPGYDISSVDDISTVDYDFIVIAVQNADMAREIKDFLIRKDVPEKKIATMDARAITEEAIPDEIVQWDMNKAKINVEDWRL